MVQSEVVVLQRSLNISLQELEDKLDLATKRLIQLDLPLGIQENTMKVGHFILVLLDIHLNKDLTYDR